MCFSALASFIAGTALSVIGVAALRKTKTRSEIPFAIIPLLGLLGISGLTNDMRESLAEAKAHTDRRVRLAIEIFCYRASKYIGSYLAAMNGADAVIFMGGIGESSPEIRRLICEDLSWMGIELEPQTNQKLTNRSEGIISTDTARLTVFVIPTDEELLIARDTVRVVEKKRPETLNTAGFNNWKN